MHRPCRNTPSCRVSLHRLSYQLLFSSAQHGNETITIRPAICLNSFFAPPSPGLRDAGLALHNVDTNNSHGHAAALSSSSLSPIILSHASALAPPGLSDKLYYKLSNRCDQQLNPPSTDIVTLVLDDSSTSSSISVFVRLVPFRVERYNSALGRPSRSCPRTDASTGRELFRPNHE